MRGRQQCEYLLDVFHISCNRNNSMACSEKDYFMLEHPDRVDGLRLLSLRETVPSSGGDMAPASWPSSDHVRYIAPGPMRATPNFTPIRNVKLYSFPGGDKSSGSLDSE